ncbi:MAG: glutamate-5-semialdehyde dehydrogenase, partial [Oscillospiraceae bacterium]
AANQEDVERAREKGMSSSLLDRLTLTGDRIADMAKGIRQVADAEEPVGRVLEGSVRPNGLRMERITVPLGVVGIIYEARPNVTADCAALCVKSGNAVILRGGKEAYCSNRAIADIIDRTLQENGLPAGSVQLVSDLSRESAEEMMGLIGYIDVLIPRGGRGLIRSVVENAKVPVIETGVGNCHIYVDADADISMAAEIVYNAKTSRPSVCNAAETLLVHRDIAAEALPRIRARLEEKKVRLRACEKAAKILSGCENAEEEDWSCEYLDYVLAVKVVDSLADAVAHIAKYSTGHSEAIITNSYAAAEEFIRRVDSAAVYVNASTRFTDGGEFGLGAEIGISTQKLHARGPMGLENLLSYKYVLRGNGQIR